MNRLGWKLTGTILLVVAVCISLTATMVNLITTSEFNRYVSQSNMSRIQNVAENIGNFYNTENEWTNIDDVIDTLVWSANARIVVADSSGLIVGDTEQEWLAQYPDAIGLLNGTPIIVSGNSIGEVFVLTSTMGNGQGSGHMGGQGQHWIQSTENSNTILDTTQQDFIDQVNRAIWISAITGIAIALILGFLLTQYLIKPIKALTGGARHITGGDLTYRVKVSSGDEIGKLTETFNTMASRLEASEQTRKQLMADITHELKTPLTVIGGTVDGIMDGVFNPDLKHLETIKEQTVTLTRLIEDLRDISLAETGQLKLEKILSDISELVNQVVIQFEKSAAEKGVHLQFNDMPALSKLLIDPSRIKQAITNLLTNAIRHTPANGTISVSIENRAKSEHFGKRHVLIYVSDTGEGIPPEHLPHIFDRFYRAKTARSRNDGGTGLGLAIASQMVQAHGGSLWVESELGKGSTFFIALPVEIT
ncbi:MAG: ATP-binding protein [Dehalococcoidales bacterium]|nr:ATP-binding protein [Dehalococcoidales bacterium]